MALVCFNADFCGGAPALGRTVVGAPFFVGLLDELLGSSLALAIFPHHHKRAANMDVAVAVVGGGGHQLTNNQIKTSRQATLYSCFLTLSL